MAYSYDFKPFLTLYTTWGTYVLTWTESIGTWEELGNSQSYTNDSK